MNLIGNLIWLVFGGLELALAWFVAGLFLCITVIGIPFGIQCFKIAGLVIWPFGKTIGKAGESFSSLFGNIIWVILFGWELAVAHFFTGLIFYITIIGIPFGKQHLKLAKLGLLPFGRTV